MVDPDKSFDLTAFANSVVMRNLKFPIISDTDEKPPFIVSLDQSLGRMASARSLLLPNLQLHTKTVLVFSDYSGESSSSRYVTYSFLFTSYDAHEPVLNRWKELRDTHGLTQPFKEVCFKDSSYGPIERSLKDWLNTADYAVGLLFTLIIDKEVVSVFGGNHRDSQRELASMIESFGFGQWKPAVAEKLIRVIHVVSYWLAALTHSEQNVCWMTDHDEIVANASFIESMQKVLAGVMNNYLPRSGQVRTALPFSKTVETFSITDFLSIPDLAAGSLESMFTHTDKMTEPRIRSQANETLLWLCRQGIGLKKLTMTIKPSADGRIQTSITRLERKNGSPEGECILLSL